MDLETAQSLSPRARPFRVPVLATQEIHASSLQGLLQQQIRRSRRLGLGYCAITRVCARVVCWVLFPHHTVFGLNIMIDPCLPAQRGSAGLLYRWALIGVLGF